MAGGHRARTNKSMILGILVKPQSLPQFISIFLRCLSNFREDSIFHSPGPQIFHKDSFFAFIFLPDVRRNKAFLVVLFGLPKKKKKAPVLGNSGFLPGANN